MTTNVYHEIRDPVHGFIRLDSDERAILDSQPVQRLRHVHQLALGYLVYPGATHTRFEHSLGAMELASRVYDTVTGSVLVHDEVRELFPDEIRNEDHRRYWRRVLRMAALCHDIGHLPFSHAAESELLPEGWSHEAITAELIRSQPMQEIWSRVTPPLRIEDIVKLAVGQAKLPKERFSDWEAVLSEIVAGDAFGVDRIDYLLRDSLHAGVGYGRFDHNRLIDTLRILPRHTGSGEPALGLELGGIHTAESLPLARYWMFSQVYLHAVRRAYDIHLKEFLQDWLPDGQFPTDPDKFLELSDVEVLAGMRLEARNGSEYARRVIERQHFRTIYSWSPEDLAINSEPGKAIGRGLMREFGDDKIRMDNFTRSDNPIEFPVLQPDGQITSSSLLSPLLSMIPPLAIDYVFVAPEIRDEARKFLADHKQELLRANDA